MMDSGHSIGGRRTFIENKRWVSLPQPHRLTKYIMLFPKTQDFGCNCRKVELLVFRIRF
jgi:hypothetical protein